MNPPRNRCAEYFERMKQQKPTTDVAKEAALDPKAAAVAAVINQAIEDSEYDGDTEVANATGVDRTSVFNLRTKGCTTKTKVLKKVCRLLGICPDAALAGKLVRVDKPSSEIPDIVALAKMIQGTEDEASFRQLMFNTVRLRRSANR